jgi:hypothetical protein
MEVSVSDGERDLPIKHRKCELGSLQAAGKKPLEGRIFRVHKVSDGFDAAKTFPALSPNT